MDQIAPADNPAAGAYSEMVCGDQITPVDILAVGAHPDDVEIACGGYLAAAVRQGYRTGIVDLTRGEMGTKGNPEIRAAEAAAGARLLGAAFRVNLGLPDSRVLDDPVAATRLAAVIRQARPTLLLGHHAQDRHPDHRGANALTQRAAFYAALRKLEIGGLPFHPVDRLLYFPINEELAPSFVVDVSATWETKLAAIKAHVSQFGAGTAEIDRRFFGKDDYLRAFEDRARAMGNLIGAAYGEGFVLLDALAVPDPVALLRRR